MKWFLGAINCSDIISKSRMEALFKENYSVSPPGNGLEISVDKCSYAEIYNNKYKSQYENCVDEDIVVLGDIEIYNKQYLLKKYFKSNKIELESKLLVDLYKLLGINFLEELSGEYSFVLYDRQNMKLYLITDHIGTKPLFWIKAGDGVYFATDIFLLKDYFNIRELNKEYFKEFYFSNGHIDSDHTPYINVKKVESGSHVCLSMKDNSEIKCKYWDLVKSTSDIRYKKNEEYIENFLKLLKNAVDNRLLHNDNDGVMMSGGIDSTSLFAIGKSIANTNITPVCGIFDELKSCDERYYINQVLDRYKQKPINVLCDEFGMLQDYPEDYFFTYEPHVNALVLKFSDGILRSAGRNGIENIIDGYAGDHLLTGSLLNAIDKIKMGKLGQAFEDIKVTSNRLNKSLFEGIREYVLGPLFYQDKLPNFDKNICTHMLGKTKRLKYFNQKELYIQINCTKAKNYLDREICPRNNISIKHPFLDKDLIEFIFNIPGDFRLNKKYNKFILREAIQQLLPNEVVNRIAKTQHVSLSIKGLAKVWPRIYSYSKDCKIRELGVINISINEWEEQLHKFRSGQVVREDFLILLTMELWLSDYYKKVSSQSYSAIH